MFSAGVTLALKPRALSSIRWVRRELVGREASTERFDVRPADAAARTTNSNQQQSTILKSTSYNLTFRDFSGMRVPPDARPVESPSVRVAPRCAPVQSLRLAPSRRGRRCGTPHWLR